MQSLIDMSKSDAAPEFSAIDSEGNKVRLSDFRGKNVFLVFNRGFA